MVRLNTLRLRRQCTSPDRITTKGAHWMKRTSGERVLAELLVAVGAAALSAGAACSGQSAANGSDAGNSNKDGSATEASGDACLPHGSEWVFCNGEWHLEGGAAFPQCPAGVEAGAECTGTTECITCSNGSGQVIQCVGTWQPNPGTIQCSP
jgi:hypothetical protein